MPKYSFIAKSQKGETYSGTREAKDEFGLARAFRQEGHILISAKQEKERGPLSFSLSAFLPFLNKVSLREKMIFTRNLQVMIGAGVSLPRVLNTLSHQVKSKVFKKVLSGVESQILKGESFSNALSKYPNIFSEFFCSMIRVGEESGTLENNLAILSRQAEREQELKTKIQSAMMYPMVIILAMFGVGAMMLIVVVPKLAQTFEELGVELPVTTKLVIWLGNFLVGKWYLAILILLISIFSFQTSFKIKAGRKLFSTVSLKIPVISPIVKKTNSTYMVRNLSALISAGVPLLRSLEIIANTLSNYYYQEAILKAIEKVKKGGKLSEALRPYQGLFSLTVIQMIEVGEETGETSSVLEKLGDFFEEEVATATKNLVAIIEPVLMLIIGGVVGFFAISMVQPMYSMLSSIK